MLIPEVRKVASRRWQPFVFEWGNDEPIITADPVKTQWEAANIARKLAEDERERRKAEN